MLSTICCQITHVTINPYRSVQISRSWQIQNVSRSTPDTPIVKVPSCGRYAYKAPLCWIFIRSLFLKLIIHYIGAYIRHISTYIAADPRMYRSIKKRLRAIVDFTSVHNNCIGGRGAGVLWTHTYTSTNFR